MPKSYSNDLRKKVIECVKEGSTYKEVAQRFKVSLAAVGKWYQRYKEEGKWEQRIRGGAAKKINIEELRKYAELNSDMKLKEASKELGVSVYTVSYWLKQLGFSYKKKPLRTWKQAKKNELDMRKL